MKNKPIISIVIGSYNRIEFLRTTIDTLRSEVEGIAHEIIVVDGGSTDGSYDWLLKQKDIITIVQHNRGEWRGKEIERKSWGYFMNLGFKIAQGKYICMLSDDCLVVPGAIKNGIKLFDSKISSKNKIGAIAFYWRNWPEQKEYWVGFSFGDKMFVNHGMYLRSAMEKVGFCNENDYFFYHADGDLCQKIWEAGYSVIDSPNSFIEHYSDANTEVRASNNKKQKLDWDTYNKKWGHLGKPAHDWKTIKFKDSNNTADKYFDKKVGKLKKVYNKLLSK
jgi:GT2 family glycosyltransferase